jgi:predicted SAM-dependent methyltransferase
LTLAGWVLERLPARVARRARTLHRAVLPDRVVSARLRIAKRYLAGDGIEIGALHNPLPLPKAARVRYVDRLPVPELRAHYPELEQEPLVEVDIIDDGERLETIGDSTQDFVIANHFLEHTQDPIRTLLNAYRVLRPGGVLYLAVPDKRHTFDVDRPLTPVGHLLRDHEEGSEVSRREEQLMEQDYSIHFHVWTQRELLELLLALRERFELDFDVELLERIEYEVVFVLRKGSA